MFEDINFYKEIISFIIMFKSTWGKTFESVGPIQEGTYEGLYMKNRDDLIEQELSPLLMGDFFQDSENVLYRVAIGGEIPPLINASYKKEVIISSCQGAEVPRGILEVLVGQDFREVK